MRARDNTEFERTAQSLRERIETIGNNGGFGKFFAVPPLDSTLGGHVTFAQSVVKRRTE